MTKADFLYMILHGELWGKKLQVPEIPTKPYHQLMRMADKQTVLGLFCHSLIRHGVRLAKYDAIETYSTLKEIEEQNKKMDAEVLALCQLLQSHHIQFVVVKGQTLATCYPHPQCRIPGDIDFYCNPSNFDKARQVLLNEWAVTFKNEENDADSDQHIAFQHNEVEFEMHFRLMTFSSSSNQRYFDQLTAHVAPFYLSMGDTRVPTLPPTENVLYTFLHLYHHLTELGVGLRQFCDMAVLIHTYHQQIDRNRLKEMLRFLGFLHAFQAIEYILVRRIGLQEAELPIPMNAKDASYEKTILNIVYKRGNFGQYGRETIVRSGFRYYLESMKIKCSHYYKLYRLSPKETRALFLKTIPHKIVLAFLRMKEQS